MKNFKRIAVLLIALFILLPQYITVSAMQHSFSLTTVADAATQNNVRYYNNYGGATTLRIRANDYFSAFFKFDLSAVDVGFVSSAKLKLTLQRVDSTEAEIKLAVASHSNWVEGNSNGTEDANSLNINNRPSFSGFVAKAKPTAANAVMEFEVPIDEIEKAREENGGSGMITFAVYVDGVADQNTAPNTYVYTKEYQSGTKAPVLEIQTDEETTDAMAVATDKAKLDLANTKAVSRDLVLPTAGYTGDTTITWAASGDNVTMDGNITRVTRPAVGAPDAAARLTATIAKGEASDTKSFDINILGLSYPADTTYCQDGSSSTFNFGANSDLKVRTETSNALYMISFIKFDLSYIERDVENAVLKITLMKDNAKNDVSALRVAVSENDGWFAGTNSGTVAEDGGISWKERPYFERTSFIGAACSGSGTKAGDVFAFDVTALVQREYLSQDGYITLAVYSDAADQNAYQFYSNRAATGRPELVVTETTDRVFINNNGAKLTDGYAAGTLQISADTDYEGKESILIAALYKDNMLEQVAINNDPETYRKVTLNIDEIDGTRIKILTFDRNCLAPLCDAILLYPTDAFEVEPKYPEWREKAATFSFDDGRLEDAELISVFDSYGIKGTFNLNSNKHTELNAVQNADWVHDTYNGHEVASHIKNHPSIDNYTVEEYIQLIKDGKDELSEMVGYEVTGMAYPLDDPKVDEITEYVMSAESGIEYARPSSPMRRDFELPPDFYNWRPSIKFTELDYYGKAFLELKDDGKMRLLYAWGHSYELNQYNYYLIHDFGAAVQNREDVYLATNIDVCLYLKALNQLEIGADYVTNNSTMPLYITINKVKYRIEPGKTICKDENNN